MKQPFSSLLAMKNWERCPLITKTKRGFLRLTHKNYCYRIKKAYDHNKKLYWSCTGANPFDRRMRCFGTVYTECFINGVKITKKNSHFCDLMS